MPPRGRSRAKPKGPIIGGKVWGPAPPPTPGQTLCWLAHRAMLAMSHGVRVLAVGAKRGGQPEPHVGLIVRISNDHPTQRKEGNGSTLLLHFDSGSTVPLEQVQQLERAADSDGG